MKQTDVGALGVSALARAINFAREFFINSRQRTQETSTNESQAFSKQDCIGVLPDSIRSDVSGTGMPCGGRSDSERDDMRSGIFRCGYTSVVDRGVERFAEYVQHVDTEPDMQCANSVCDADRATFEFEQYCAVIEHRNAIAAGGFAGGRKSDS